MITTPDTTAGKSFLNGLTNLATSASQAPAKITIPHTVGNPNLAAAAMLEGK
jgi:hypothetical protein